MPIPSAQPRPRKSVRHKQWLSAEIDRLMREGHTQASAGRELGLPRQAVHRVVNEWLTPWRQQVSGSR